eukprot:scaffold6317_cov98-Phaeocystis_antarctica.AAC.7
MALSEWFVRSQAKIRSKSMPRLAYVSTNHFWLAPPMPAVYSDAPRSKKCERRPGLGSVSLRQNGRR